MSAIAKGTITLTTLNDAFNVSLSPNSCVVRADFDGSNPQLEAAYTDIAITCGASPVPTQVRLIESSNPQIRFSTHTLSPYKVRVQLTEIPTTLLSGSLVFEASSGANFSAPVTFQFSVVRDGNMLDWVQDWENQKTKVGSTYLITPKIFVGKQVRTEADMAALTGVYIGPDQTNGAGIYGYNAGNTIFQINDKGGVVAGWNLTSNALQTPDGKLQILSEGSIVSTPENNQVAWGIYKSGEAIFANGNVRMSANGSASFTGEITATSGAIGGWKIDQNSLSSRYLRIDSQDNYIGLSAQGGGEDPKNATEHANRIKSNGGVIAHWKSATDYGIKGYLPSTGTDRVTFSLGSENKIAGWSFDDTALWLNTKNNTAKSYMSSGGITIGSNGMRGKAWYIDASGDVSFVNGKIQFNGNGEGEIVGWKLNPNRLATSKTALLSDGSLTGLYLSAAQDANLHTRASTGLEQFIASKGGIIINAGTASTQLSAYTSQGEQIFSLKSNEYSSIASWKFNHQSIYTGEATLLNGFTRNSGSLVLSASGLHGHKWQLLADGSGSLAGNQISWNANGEISFANTVKIGMENLGSTIINSDGVLTGKISADNITAGTISTADISNKNGTWFLKQDGSGQLANGSVVWDENGRVTFSKSIHVGDGATIGFWNISKGSILSEDTAQGTLIKLSAIESKLYAHTNQFTGMAGFEITPNGALFGVANMSCGGDFGLDGSRAAICATAMADLPANQYRPNRFVAGVCGQIIANMPSTGSAANSYGGYFQRLRANGLHVSCDVSHGGLISMDCTFTAAAVTDNDPTFALPAHPYQGQLVIFTTYNKRCYIKSEFNQILYGTSPKKQISVPGTCRMLLFVFDGKYWRVGRMESI